MKYLLLLLLLLSFNSIAADYSQEILSLVLPRGGKSSSIKTQACKYQQEKWLKLLLAKESFKEKITFNKNCDIQGEFTPKMNEFFKAPLKIKDHKEIDSSKLNIKFSVVFEEMPILKIELKDSLIALKNKTNIHFALNYGYELDLFGKEPIKKSRGGVFSLFKKDGKTILKSIKLN